MDCAYSQLSDATLRHLPRSVGMELVFRPKGAPPGSRLPFSPFAIVIDRQLFSALMPKDLRRELPWPPYGFL